MSHIQNRAGSDVSKRANLFGRLLCVALGSSYFLLLSACEKNVQIKTSKATLQAETGLVFPPDTKILHESDGGGRDATYDFFEWVVFSKSHFEIPAKNGEEKQQFKDSLDTSIAILERKIGPLSSAHAKSSTSSSWRLSGHRFDGTLIEVDSGYFLIIRRIKEN